MKQYNNNQLWAEIQEGMRRSLYTGRVFSSTDLPNTIRTMEELKQALGHRWRERLSNLAGLCHAQKHLTKHQDGLQEFPISCKSKGMLARFGTHQNASKVISVACDIGLLVRTNDYYASGAGLSKCYIWNKSVEMLIMEFAKSEKIMPKMPFNSRKTSSKAIQNLSKSQQPPSPLLSPPSSNGATIPTGGHFGRLMRKATKEELYAGLVQSYPQLPYFQKYADELNAAYHQDAPEEIISFTPTYSFSKRGTCTNIGIRATSTACNLPSQIKAEAAGKIIEGDDYKRYREYYLSRMFGMPYWLLAHYDVKSSIYRTTYYLNTGEWLPQDVDFYPLMYAGLKPDEANGYEFENAAKRADYKQACMRLYFCKSSAEQWNKMRRAGMLSGGIPKEEQLAEIAAARQKMRRAVGGKTYGPEIFLHESCLLMMLRGELYKRGVRTSQCYDGFWSDDQHLSDLCEEILPVVAAAYRERWCNK